MMPGKGSGTTFEYAPKSHSAMAKKRCRLSMGRTGSYGKRRVRSLIAPSRFSRFDRGIVMYRRMLMEQIDRRRTRRGSDQSPWCATKRKIRSSHFEHDAPRSDGIEHVFVAT